jgi:hypothetical protein
VRRESHASFCERPGVQLLRPTHQATGNPVPLISRRKAFHGHREADKQAFGFPVVGKLTSELPCHEPAHDQAGWRVATKLPIPDTITLIAMPPEISGNSARQPAPRLADGRIGSANYDAILDPIASPAISSSTCRGESRPWIKRLSISVMINETWYQLMATEFVEEGDSPSSRATFPCKLLRKAHI